MAIIHEISMDGLDAVGRHFLDLVDPVRATVTDNEDIAGYLHRGQDLHIPSYLDGQLDDYMLALDAAPMDPVLITSRVKAIFLTIIAATQKHHDLTCLSSEDLRRVNKNLYVSFNQAVTIPTPVDGEIHYLRGIADGILWCGSERELEANLVIQKTDGVADGQGARLPPVMLMLHYSRRISERHSEIYGIITNSYKWRFLRIDNDSRYFEVTLDWNDEVGRKKIANLLRDIAYDAMRLAISRPAPLSEHDASVYEMSGCRIWMNKAESEQLLDDESAGSEVGVTQI